MSSDLCFESFFRKKELLIFHRFVTLCDTNKWDGKPGPLLIKGVRCIFYGWSGKTPRDLSSL